MKIFFLLLTFIFSINTFSQQGKKVPEKKVEIVLGIDKIEKLDFAPSTKVQVGNDSILNHQIIPQKREITFKGLKPGNTSVIIRNTVGERMIKYLVNITATDQSKVVQDLKEYLGDVEGLEIGIKGNKVFVGGQIVVPSDIGRVVVVLADYQDVVQLVELSPQTQRVIAKNMQKEIQKSNMPDVTVRVANGLFMLEGVVSSDADRTRAEQLAAIYVPDMIQNLARRTEAVQTAKKNIIQNFISVNAKKKPQPVPKMVKISAQFVELTKDYNKIFGFKWEPTLAGAGGSISFGRGGDGGVTSGSNGTLSGTISNLFPRLASAKGAGHARVIQSGVVITKDKVTSKVVKKSEKPFAIGTGEFQRSETATAGFDLSVTPTILPQEKIDLNMAINVSATIGDPPETISNTIQTALVVKSKESAVVGGVVINKTSTDFDRNPPGGVDQVEDGQQLFSFLKSKSYLTNKSQFVVFVTPEVIESASTGTEEIKRKFRSRRR
jgi:pilus assembly protein CpaC